MESCPINLVQAFTQKLFSSCKYFQDLSPAKTGMRGFQSYLRNCITDLNRKLGYNQSKNSSENTLRNYKS